ncbi:MAG: transcription-repair coupling factor [Alphaproteobacteria bacterium]|nr:transcription-repair coupling factor [Alphaproteobacteria bacterium]
MDLRLLKEMQSDLQQNLTKGLIGSKLSLEASVHLFSEFLKERPLGDKALPVFLVSNRDQLERTKTLLEFFKPKEYNILVFSPWDCLPYDRISPSKQVMSERLHTLITLSSLEKKPYCLITTVGALLQKLPPPSTFQNRFLDLKVGHKTSLTTLQTFFQENGYERTEIVTAAGTYAVRGGIVDVFPPGSETPVRLDFFGDELEEMKSFDPETQRTLENRSMVKLLPTTEVFLTKTSQEFFREQYRKNFGVESTKDPLYEAIASKRPFPGQEHWLPYFYPTTTDLLTYTGPVTIFMPLDAPKIAKAYEDQVRDHFQARLVSQPALQGGASYRPVPPADFYYDWDTLKTRMGEGIHLMYTSLNHPDGVDKGYSLPVDLYHLPKDKTRDQVLAAYLKSTKKPVVIMTESSGYFSTIQDYITHHTGMNVQEIVRCPDIKSSRGVFLSKGFVSEGFQTEDLEVISGDYVLGRSLQAHPHQRRKKGAALFEIMNFQPGELLVHRDYGVGKYQGLHALTINGTTHDCLKMEYDQGDVLYVPVENMDVLSFYGTSGDSVVLDRLGGGHWEVKKARAQKRIQEIAERLILLAAERQQKTSHPFLIDQEAYQTFCRGFPYVETEDQFQAIQEILRDLGLGKPMDRLLCGDVGFGKTEVALRAAFVVAQSGYQVAVISPTTILCAQHTQTFKRRFAHFPLRIESLSRVQKPSATKDVYEGLKSGAVSIVIGTHALLSSKISFKNLGLVIVDEEQHFGVKQKEYLKNLVKEVHVLSMSATPIPRSLQMAISGIRDLSIIATPPVDRLSVHTYVMPYDHVTVREAVLREFHRGGQVFYVCPRVADLQGIYDSLTKLVPEVKIALAHGGMNPDALTQTMEAFENHGFDVLVATNIVESGLDIPNANTLIVHRSDLFGLSQLYQLRGRVGRSKVRGYAYFTFTADKILTDNALKRLEVIQSLEGLGGGFSLASRDMDIRGMGNLVGEEQSGHIKDVGVSLYHHMLEEALLTHQGKGSAQKTEPSWVPQIHVPLDVFIPERYISDLNLRLSFYRRLSDIGTKIDAEDLKAEMIDRFGHLPPEVLNLFKIVHLKNLCKILHLEKIEVGPKGILVTFYKNECPYFERLFSWINTHGGTLRVRPDNKMVIMKAWKTTLDQVDGLIHLFRNLRDCLV